MKKTFKGSLSTLDFVKNQKIKSKDDFMKKIGLVAAIDILVCAARLFASSASTSSVSSENVIVAGSKDEPFRKYIMGLKGGNIAGIWSRW